MPSLLLLEDLYRQHCLSQIDAKQISEASELAEQWLLSFSRVEDPYLDALRSLGANAPQNPEKRFYFVFSLALCEPTTNTGKLFSVFSRTLNQNAQLIGKWVGDAMSDIYPVHTVNVLKAFESTLKKHYPLAYSCYQTYAVNVRLAAVACDNLKVFMNTLPDDPGKSHIAKFEALAHFPIKPESVIHQAVVGCKKDERELVYFCLEALRKQLASDYKDGITYLRPTDPSKPVIQPQGWLESPAPGAHLPIYQHPSFKAALSHDPSRYIKQFFIHRDSRLDVSPSNWIHVDDVCKAFLRAGVPAERIIDEGTCGKVATRTTLKSALTKLGQITVENQRYYQEAYKTYLAKYSTQEILDNCINPATLLAAYNATGNRVLLQAGSGLVRDSAMATDLGL
ncbi:hypothetical protein [Pseudomonas amygdali]|uniref:Uncharacterized protein n=3 Tax=Pseudomonas amygdali TaxID=47877 RepID=A0ABR5KQD7_PSEAV|nr:hypothetical protein [Pseudomonas amygdali]AXH59574.1 hypothetical protein PLA107_030580 [Pseudomonas amygdali pv. lachrymans str. M301315]KPC16999.1 Uncharacterized protein AC499_0201 [Pseudomonas amygdali pv. lachrymans]KPC17958.1 Uncharacterized protein AC499_1160 [Pseudomonas amygdali pv. lachrymans]